MTEETEEKKDDDFEWTCANVFDHESGKKIIQDKEGNCPDCSRPLFKTKSCFFVKSRY